MRNPLHNPKPTKAPLTLPRIVPSFDTPRIPETLDAALTNPSQTPNPIQHIRLFKMFEKEFNSDCLSKDFDRILDEQIRHRNVTALTLDQPELMKAISKEVRVKLFQQYVKKVKKRHPFRYSMDFNSQWSQPHTSHVSPTKQTPTPESPKNLREKSSQIFGKKGSVSCSQSPYNNRMKAFYKKLNNKKLYYQMISPVYYQDSQNLL